MALIGPENPTPGPGHLTKYDPSGPNTTMAHQELAAEIMAMRVAADEAEEKRIERKMVHLCWASNNTVSVYDVGGSSSSGLGNINDLFDAGWSIERELKVQRVEHLRNDMACTGWGARDVEITETTKVKQEPMETTMLVLVRKAPRNGD